MSVKEILILAKERLEEGWGQGRYYNNETQCYCIAGAIWQCTGGLPGGNAAIAAVAKAIKPDALTSEGTVVKWNDDPRRTKQEVLQKIQEAIDATD